MQTFRNLVIANAGPDSQHRQWIDGDRSYAVWLVCEPDVDPGDLPADVRVFEVTAGAPPFAKLHAVLTASMDDWREGGHVFFAADDLDATPEEIEQTFASASARALAVAQPSLGWRSHFESVTTLHNPGLELRYVSRVDTGALCVTTAHLLEILPLFEADPWGAALGQILPALQAQPSRGAAVIDAVQVLRTQPIAAPSDEALQMGAAIVERLGVTLEGDYSWGGVDRDGKTLSLFDETREHFLGRLLCGYATAVQDPQPLGEVLVSHLVRSLDKAPRQVLGTSEGADERPVRCLSMYWDSVAPGVLQAQRRVFRALGLPLTQLRTERTLQGDWMMAMLERAADDEIVVFCDVDAFPLKAEVFHRAVQVARDGGIFGVAQTSSHVPATTEVYAGPAFLAFSMPTWRDLGCPDLRATADADVAQLLTRLARRRNATIELLRPTACLEPRWALGNDGVFGVGTFYGEQEFFRMCEAKDARQQAVVHAVADDVIDGHQLSFRRYLEAMRAAVGAAA